MDSAVKHRTLAPGEKMEDIECLRILWQVTCCFSTSKLVQTSVELVTKSILRPLRAVGQMILNVNSQKKDEIFIVGSNCRPLIE